MTVVLSDGGYTVRKRPYPPPQDAHGTPAPGALAAAGASRAGGAVEQTDGTWRLRLDPAEWPVRPGDVVTGPESRVWTIIGNPRLHRNVAADDVDYISARASLDEGPVVEPYEP
jgi:hypothetical protein